MRTKVASFVREMRRRRVFRVIVVYALVAWGLLQVGEIVFPALGLPEWSLTLLVALAAFGFPIVLVLAWAFDMHPEGIVKTEARDSGSPEPPPPGRAVESVGHDNLDPDALAVLPFANMSPDAANEYFSDGISEDLITRLCAIGTLRVISRASSWQYKDRRIGARQIAGELGVAYLVDGSVRRSSDDVRIGAQLIDARSDRHVWSETYDRRLEDIFAIQTDVASRIAAALHRELTAPGEPQSIRGNGPPDLIAYDEFLRGRFHWNRRTASDLERSVEHFRAAIEADPDFTRARAALAEAYVTQAIYGLRSGQDVLPQARREAEEALRREAGEPSALSALATVLAIHDWRWDAAAEAFGEAVAAHPEYSTAPQWFATNVLVPLGRFDEAVSQLDRARAVDPKSPAIEASLGVVDFMRRDFREALSRFDRLIERRPDFAFGHYYRGLSAQYLGDSTAAISALQLARVTGGWSAEILAALGGALAVEGREAEAREVLASITAPEVGRYVSPVRIAQLHAALGDRPASLDALERAASSRAADLIWIDVSPAFDILREEPRFLEVRNRVFGERPR